MFWEKLKTIKIQSYLVVTLVFAALIALFIFVIKSSKLVLETNRSNFAYNIEVVEYIEALDEIFQRSEANTKIFADTIKELYNINKLHDEKYNEKFAYNTGLLGKNILKDLPGGQGCWFQPDVKLPFASKVYNWYVIRDGKMVDYKKELDEAYPEIRKLTPESDPYYFNAIKNKKPTWSDVYKDPDSKIKMITLSHPVYKKGILIGVVGIDISLDSLQVALKDIQGKFEGSEIYLLDEHKHLIIARVAEGKEVKKYPEILKHLVEGEPKNTIIDYKENGKNRIAVEIPLHNDFFAVITFPTVLAFKGFDRLFSTIYFIFAILVFLTITAFLSRSKISQINRDLLTKTAQLMGVYNAAPSMIIIKNKEGVYVECNKKFLEFYGLEREEVIGKTEFEVFDEETAQQISAQEKLVRDLRQTVVEENWCIKHDGEKAWIVKYRVPLFDQNDEYIGTLINGMDITKKAQEREFLRHAKDEAERATMMKSNFLANVSHEIRTPLNGVLGFLQLLEDTETTEEQREFIEDAKKSSVILLSVINEILDFSKIEAGKMKIDNISFDIRSVIEDITIMATANAEMKKIEICSLICSDVPQKVYGDPGRVKQILNNLVNNAIKFTQKGDITIHVGQIYQNDGEAVIGFEVKDTGIGIEKEKLDLIFESFTQADPSTTRKFGGTGLGLAISKNLAHLMNGKLTVESQIEKGSTFTLLLPFKIDSSSPCEINPSINILDGKKILLVDNNQTDLKVFNYYLNELNCIIKQAQGIEEALEILNSEKDEISAIVIDYNIQNSSDCKLCTIIKNDERLKHIPMILHSSVSKIGDAIEAREKGFAGYLSKPIKKKELLETLSLAISHKNSDPQINFVTKHIIKENKFSEKIKVLVVEDSELNSKFISKVLNNCGISCDLAFDGQQGVEAFNRNHYDMIFMDCQMPIMDGYQATQEIRKIEDGKSHIPIVALTANAFKIDMDRCKEAGMDDYISKPIKVDLVTEILKKYLKGQELKCDHSNIGNDSCELKTDEYIKSIIRGMIDEYSFSEEEAQQFFNQYVDFLSTSILDIENYSKNQDFDNLKRVAHKLKGASSNFKINEIAAICAEIEHMTSKEETFSIETQLNSIKDFVQNNIK